MTISPPRSSSGSAAAAGLLVALAGCGSRTRSRPRPRPKPRGGAVEGFKPCIVSDDGGFNDKSFNQSALEGLRARRRRARRRDHRGRVRFGERLRAEPREPRRRRLHAHRRGRLQAARPTRSRRRRRTPTSSYAIIDTADNTGATTTTSTATTDAPNIKPLMFDTAQAAYLGGYAAAAWSAQPAQQGRHVRRHPDPARHDLHGRLRRRRRKYNEDKGAAVETARLGRRRAAGLVHRRLRRQRRRQAAAAGSRSTRAPTCSSPSAARSTRAPRRSIRDCGTDIVMLGVDADLARADPTVADLVLVSIMKRIDVGRLRGRPWPPPRASSTSTPYVGTLENEGVGSRAFGDFESKSARGLHDELDASAGADHLG